ncbi:hypothetical protein C8F04DRAFT_1140813 [Mycena alexandri]|uniref:Uncharacterized protein n=1 Tax=Mycena alexandri TaxID=1745969 RepID=A0AAD6S5U1_9AGAR|nr:hypothetical protein C8F04DRAFT_1140813 [Mycena alexandri]
MTLSRLPPNIPESAVLRLTLENPPSPQRVPVVRPPHDVPDVKMQAHMWVIPRAKDPSYLPSANFPLLLRQEYHNILVALLWYLDRKREAAPAHMKQTFPDPPAEAVVPPESSFLTCSLSVDDRVDVDGCPVEQINVPPRQVNVPPHQNHSPGPDELCIPEHMPDVSEATIFPNPFLDPYQGNLYRAFGALIITGLPGIGKTVLLAVIFWLRVAANLPTAYMADPNVVLVYTGVHFFVHYNPTLIPVALERSGWVLVDSNVRNVDPPQVVIDSGRFIVQATSPSASRTQWARKNQGSGIRLFCLMQPWTLDELFAGSSLQIEQRRGADIHAFFQKFGGSARHVYDDSHQLPAFDDLVKEAAVTLVNDTELIRRVIQLPAPDCSIDDKVGYMLVTPLPLDDRNRTQFRMASPTSYLQDLLILQLDRNLQTARRLLYVINAGVRTPGCKATTADLLDKHHHWFIGEGGRWPLRKFKKSPDARSGVTANIWRVQEEDCGKVLLAHGRISIETVSKAKQQPKALAVIRTPTAELKHLHKHQFYRPRGSTFPTFDSFYIDRRHHAFVFQASEADTTHIVQDPGRVWLEGHGINEFTYIYVSGPNMDRRPTISLPVEHESQFIDIYHLVLDYPEVRNLLDTNF